MRFLLPVLLLCDTWIVENPVDYGLYYLARHQNEDGSWGRKPEGCRCDYGPPTTAPHRIPVDPAVELQFVRILERFKEDDISLRERAQQDILRLGSDAAPLLYATSSHRDLEIAGRCRDTLRRLWTNDAETRERWDGLPPGSEGGIEVQATSLALLCFLGAGYTHLSKDERCDPAVPERTYCYGKMVKKALQWLLDQQDDEGCFAPCHPTANAIAVLALSEAYGMTAAVHLKEPAQRAVDCLVSTAFNDTSFNVWKTFALKSAVLSELTFPRTTIEEQYRLLREDPSSLALAGLVYLHKSLNKPAREGPDQLSKVLNPDTLEPEVLSVATCAAYRAWGPQRAEWKAWSDRIKARCVPTQVVELTCAHGSCAGPRNGYGQQMLSTLHWLDTMQRYYRYAHVFGATGQ